MAKPESNWKDQLQELLDKKLAEKRQQEEQRAHRLRVQLARDFLYGTNVVVTIQDAKVDREATEALILLTGMHVTFEGLLEFNVHEGELVSYGSEYYSLPAMIQQPFYDTDQGLPRFDCHLSMDEIKERIAERHLWITQGEYQLALETQLQKARDRSALYFNGYITPTGEERYDFFKNNTRPLDPADGRSISVSPSLPLE